MEFNKKNIIIGFTLLLVFLLVMFNLELFTGEVTRQPATTVSVVPNRIKAGDYINVRINPGSGCAEKKIKIYREGKLNFIASFERESLGPRGGYRFCNPTVAVYKSWSTWKRGAYYVLVKDVVSNSNVKASFFIE